MKKITSLLLLIILLSSSCFAQSSVWEVKGKGTTLYLGGSIHLLRSQDYPLPSEFDEAFSKSKELVFEADLKEFENPSNAQKMMMKMMYMDGRTLKTVLNDEAYQALAEEFEASGLPLTNFQQFKPSMVVLTLTVMKLKFLGVASQGVDMHYYSKGEKNEKSFSFLETVDEQLNILASMGEGYESEYILYSLKDLENIEQEIQVLIDEWRVGKGNEAIKQIQETKDIYPDLYAALLTKRNDKWLPKIELLLENETTEFVLVGFAHLLGDDGLLKKLKENGYTVEQLN